MSLSDVMLTCPHCRREYRVSIDLAKLARVTSRAACARCKKIFDVTPERMRGLDAPRVREPTLPPEPIKVTIRSRSVGAVEERTRSAEDPAAREPAPLAIPRALSARLTPRTRSREAVAAASPARTRSREAVAAVPAPPPAPAPVSNAEVVDPDSDWLVRADPGLGALTAEVSEGATALQWLLEH